MLEDGPSNAVILHEDKQYYPTAQQVYGPGVETLVQEEDAQPLSQPIIAPIQQKKFAVQEADLPPVYFSRDFMTDLMNFPDQIRNFAFAGHLHHGKTALMDMLVMQTHDISDRLEKRTGRKRDEQLRYTDVHILERERGITIKSAPMSLILQGSRGKSHLFNILDTPGHVNFVDEVAASFRLVDGVVLVVDVVEGVQINTEQIIKYAVLEDLPLTLIVNKMDRLILELKLPPTDAYFKLKHVIEEVNTVIENTLPGQGEKRRLSPEKGNVAFASSGTGWIFTLPSFAKMYADSYPDVNAKDFSVRLWGDIFFNPNKRSFTRKGTEERSKRTFVNFILEPIYKLYSHTISEAPEDLKATLATLGIQLKPSQYKTDAKDLLKMVCEQFFGGSEGFVDMIVEHISSPAVGAKMKLNRYYTGPMDTKVASSIEKCDQDGPLVVQITKLFNTPDATGFHSFGRVMSGIAKAGQQVRVLGEGYTVDDEEDMALSTISDTWIAESRYNIPTSGVPAGNWVLLSGIDNSIVKTATLVPPRLEDDEDAYIFKPIKHFTESVFKVAVEPINPSELPKMLDGLRKVNKSYPLVTTKVEESGEHIILGTGELYMDCVLHDLRRLYSEMELKVSDPVTRFCETVVETSAIMCYARTPNKKNKITMVAEPLEDGIAQDIESGRVNIKDPIRKVGQFFEEKYDWDKLASRSIWAFGPDEMGPNILQDDTLPSQVDKKLVLTVRDPLRQGFSWGTREGPLCEERKSLIRPSPPKESPFPPFKDQLLKANRHLTQHPSFSLSNPQHQVQNHRPQPRHRLHLPRRRPDHPHRPACPLLILSNRLAAASRAALSRLDDRPRRRRLGALHHPLPTAGPRALGRPRGGHAAVLGARPRPRHRQLRLRNGCADPHPRPGQRRPRLRQVERRPRRSARSRRQASTARDGAYRRHRPGFRRQDPAPERLGR